MPQPFCAKLLIENNADASVQKDLNTDVFCIE